MTECVAAHACITCGDVAVPMRVLKIDRDRGLALCSDEHDRHESVEIALVGSVVPEEILLVHAGTALGRAAEGDAARGTAVKGASAGHAAVHRAGVDRDQRVAR
jgi:hydrogenase maturation factor